MSQHITVTEGYPVTASVFDSITQNHIFIADENTMLAHYEQHECYTQLLELVRSEARKRSINAYWDGGEPIADAQYRAQG